MKTIKLNQMEENISNFLNYLLGKRENYSFENRIFNAVTIFISITGFVTIIYNVILNSEILQTIISLLCGIVFLFCYIYSLKTKKFYKLM